MRNADLLSFSTHDGVDLVYRHWPAETGLLPGQTRRAIVLFHRGHEHGGRIAHLVDELNLPDCDFFAWDARGHGQSPGKRGDSPGFGASVRDVQTFMEHIGHHHGVDIHDVVIVAQSVGAVIAAAWVHDYAPRIRAMVLASPAFKVKLYVPFARSGLKLMRALRGNFFINSYVKAKFLSHDPERIASYNTDPLITRAISVNVLLGLYDTAERVINNAQSIDVPTQLLISGADFVVHRRPQTRFFERLGTTYKEMHVLPGFFHDTLGEAKRALATQRIHRFITRQFHTDSPPRDLLYADQQGWSCAEAEALATPLPKRSVRGLYWQATRAGLRFGARFSRGLRLGIDTGFDSGSTLDYVYRNQPEGAPPLGKLIDRRYLSAIGWRGIRQRKLNIEDLLSLAMSQLREANQPVRIVDIAAGHGRYILDAIARSPERPDAVLLRDYSEINVREGQALINAKGLSDVATFVQADAFDQTDLAALAPRPTLAVVSGLYELFADNAMVSGSLAGLADAMDPGALLIYTNQPWHPQLEFIARALTSHRAGQAWVMRRRSQSEMDQLVEHAGFRKITQRVDEWGIFTVSLALRTR